MFGALGIEGVAEGAGRAGARAAAAAERTDRPRPEPRLRIGIAASGRFHLLDLARELDQSGAEVRFYSYVPRKRAEQFGLPRRCHVALLPGLFPLVFLERLYPRFFPRLVERLMCWALDTLVVLRMTPCDIFICMSGMYVLAPWYAKRRYGAKICVHRASKHILAQKEILARLPGAQQVTDFMVRRELRGYELADQISIPSAHVAASFARWPELARKLFQNPFGVDIEQFPLRPCDRLPTTPMLLFVGHWSYRKGVDVLAQAVRTIGDVRLIHVGPVTDAALPSDPRFTHYDPVPQARLSEFYAKAQVFVLASREDGFGYVLSQALSSGLSVVCTDQTGGADLARLPGLSRFIKVVPAGDVEALRDALEEALAETGRDGGLAPITEQERQSLSWRCYAARELEFMRTRLRAALAG